MDKNELYKNEEKKKREKTTKDNLSMHYLSKDTMHVHFS